MKEKGEITEEEYVRHLLVHFRDAWHDEDEMKPWDPPISKLKSEDLFGYSIWLRSSRSTRLSKGWSRNAALSPCS